MWYRKEVRYLPRAASCWFLPEPGGRPRPRFSELGENGHETAGAAVAEPGVLGDTDNARRLSGPYFRGRPLFFFFAAFFIVEPPLSLPDLTAQVWKEFRIVLCVFRQWRIWIHLCVIRQLRCQWFLCMFLSLHSSSFCNLKETIYMFFYSKAQEWIVLYMCPLSVYALG